MYSINFYIWLYFTKDIEIVKCNICNITYRQRRSYNILQHVKIQHREIYNRTFSNVSHKRNGKSLYSTIQDNKIKCNICHKTYNQNYYACTSRMKKHLKNKHQIDNNAALEHRNWILHCNHVTLNLNNTMKCKYCNQIFRYNNHINLMKHLTNAHQINIPLQFRFMR